MVDTDTFFRLLSEVCDELPDEFFKELHHGVILDAGSKMSPYAQNSDLWILGEYQSGIMGNKVTVFYGSFEHLYSHLSEEQMKNKIREVVRHEFRHHLENRAGMRGRDSLEYEDMVHLRQYMRNTAKREHS